MKCLKSLGFLVLLSINLGMAVVMASGTREIGECLSYVDADGVDWSHLGYCQRSGASPTPIWQTALIAIGIFIVMTIVGALVVWAAHIVWRGIEKATVGVTSNLGSTYNDNRSINIVNIDGRRYLIKDDKAIPLPDE